jgi:hypothetical protein
MLCLLICAISLAPVFGQSLRTDTFAVACYDVGRAALQGKEGIVEVNNGWQDRHEVNRVTYDPDRIERQTIENRLRHAGTYIETMNNKPGDADK